MEKEKYIKALESKGYFCTQPYVNKNSYHAYSNNSKAIIHFHFDDIEESVYVGLQGYGSCPPLIAKNEKEFLEAVEIWFRNRYSNP